MRGLISLVLIPFTCGLAARLQSTIALPAGATATAMKIDSTGIYIAGSLKPSNPRSTSDLTDAFLTKLSPDGSQTLFRTVVSGSASDQINDIALTPNGAILAAGTSSSADFPATGEIGSASSKAFYARFDSKGALVSATFTGGSSDSSGEGTTVDSSGAAYLTGRTGLPATGAYIAKFDASGAPMFTSTLIGGSHIALDPQGNIYVSGTFLPPNLVPTTAGTFQPTAPSPNCANSSRNLPCYHQYVAKLDPLAGRLLYSTFVAGTREEGPTALAVDSQGNAYLAGTTTSPDYPVTPGAYQPFSLAGPLPKPMVGVGPTIPDPATGFVTEVNSTGTALIFSTYLGGSSMDTVTSLALDASSNIYIAGAARSVDFPGLSGVPGRCSAGPYVTRLSAGGASLSETQILYGAAVSANTIVALDAAGKSWIAQASTLARADLFTAPNRFACATDAADFAVLSRVAPGQLLTLFGDNLELGDPAAASPPFGGNYPTSLGGLSVTFNGTPAPLLYVSPSQVNLQVPFELAGQTSAHMQISLPTVTTAATETRDFSVVERAPSVFIVESGELRCGATTLGGWHPAALNPDGTGNSCNNPAPRGSIVTVLLQGVGITVPAQSTGAITTESQPLNLSLANTDGTTRLIAAASIPGSVSGLWAIQLQILTGTTATFTVAALPLRETALIIWTK